MFEHNGLPLDACRGVVDSNSELWRFRLIGDPDSDGNLSPLIPVEIRSKKFQGFINNGDFVQITKGKWGSSRTLEATELRDQTTQQ